MAHTTSSSHSFKSCGCASWRRRLTGLICSVIAIGLPLRASAAGNLILLDAPPAQTTWAIGVSTWSMPTYPGATTHRHWILPALDAYGASGWFVSTDNGLGWNLSSRSDLQAGWRLWPQFGRQAPSGPSGLVPVGDRLQVETFANFAPLSVLLLQSGLLYGAGRRHDGAQFEMGVTSGLPIGDDLVGATLAVNWANGAYRQSYFGVSTSESAASGLATTRLSSGWHDASLLVSAEHRFDDRWRLSGQVMWARLLGTAARSPIAASVSQTTATVTLWRGF